MKGYPIQVLVDRDATYHDGTIKMSKQRDKSVLSPETDAMIVD